VAGVHSNWLHLAFQLLDVQVDGVSLHRRLRLAVAWPVQGTGRVGLAQFSDMLRLAWPDILDSTVKDLFAKAAKPLDGNDQGQEDSFISEAAFLDWVFFHAMFTNLSTGQSPICLRTSPRVPRQNLRTHRVIGSVNHTQSVFVFLQYPIYFTF
jgi:hypothetical protein